MTARIVVGSQRLRDPFETPTVSEAPQSPAQTPVRVHGRERHSRASMTPPVPFLGPSKSMRSQTDPMGCDPKASAGTRHTDRLFQTPRQGSS